MTPLFIPVTVTNDPDGKTPCELSSPAMDSSNIVATSSISAADKPVMLTVVASCPVLVTFDTVVSVVALAVLELTTRLVSDNDPPDDSA
jgi:hypothetical protein